MKGIIYNNDTIANGGDCCYRNRFGLAKNWSRYRGRKCYKPKPVEEEEKPQLILNKFPDSIRSIIEKININLLKYKYSKQSDILIGNYSIDINSRLIKKNYENLKLTEREIEIILFLQNSKEPQSIENLQRKVWGHNSDLETHTVETHIYRLRKKISDKFNDYALSVYDQLRDNDFRVKIDSRSEKMGAKIRDAEIDRIPIMIIVGENEVNDNTFSVRRKFKGNLGSISVADFINQIDLNLNNIKNNEHFVLTFGHINAGYTFNVIPDKLVLKGTLRYLNNSDRDIIYKRINKLIDEFGSKNKVKIIHEVPYASPPVINDTSLTNFL